VSLSDRLRRSFAPERLLCHRPAGFVVPGTATTAPRSTDAMRPGTSTCARITPLAKLAGCDASPIVGLDTPKNSLIASAASRS